MPRGGWLTVGLTKATVRGLSEQMEAPRWEKGKAKSENRAGHETVDVLAVARWGWGVRAAGSNNNALANSDSALFSFSMGGDCLGIEGQDGRGI